MQKEILNRRASFKAIAFGGVASLLTACGINNPEKPSQIPLQELIDHPDKYKDMSSVTTQGYPEQVGKKVILIPIIHTDKIGNTSMMKVDWITSETDIYKLHTTSDIHSPALDFTISGGVIYFPVVPIPPGGTNMMMTEQYTITGRLSLIRTSENAPETYILQASSGTKTSSTK